MTLVFPNSADQELQRLHVYFPVTEEKLAARYRESDYTKHATTEPGAFAFLRIGTPSSEAPQVAFSLFWNRVPGGSLPDSEAISAIGTEVGRFIGTTADAWVFGEYSIPSERSPKHGIVPAMQGISTDVGGYTLSLAGAKMSIKGPHFIELEWSTESSGAIRASLSARNKFVVSYDIFRDVNKFLREGIALLLLNAD
ncbi:MAG: hypothetical protein K8T91_18230 [Planctomycetes bacterium]|nr:hypothetical protein [Planctomycetota bacterium]